MLVNFLHECSQIFEGKCKWSPRRLRGFLKSHGFVCASGMLKGDLCCSCPASFLPSADLLTFLTQTMAPLHPELQPVTDQVQHSQIRSDTTKKKNSSFFRRKNSCVAFRLGCSLIIKLQVSSLLCFFFFFFFNEKSQTHTPQLSLNATDEMFLPSHLKPQSLSQARSVRT